MSSRIARDEQVMAAAVSSQPRTMRSAVSRSEPPMMSKWRQATSWIVATTGVCEASGSAVCAQICQPTSASAIAARARSGASSRRTPSTVAPAARARRSGGLKLTSGSSTQTRRTSGREGWWQRPSTISVSRRSPPPSLPWTSTSAIASRSPRAPGRGTERTGRGATASTMRAADASHDSLSTASRAHSPTRRPRPGSSAACSAPASPSGSCRPANVYAGAPQARR